MASGSLCALRLTIALCAIVVAGAVSHETTVAQAEGAAAEVKGVQNCTKDLAAFKNCTKAVKLESKFKHDAYCKYIQDSYNCFPKSCCDNKVEKEALDTLVGDVMGFAVSLAGCGEVALKQCGMSAAEESKCREAMEGFSDCWVKQEIEDKTNATHYCTYMQEVYKCFPKECCEGTVQKAALASMQTPYKTFLDTAGCRLELNQCVSSAIQLRRSVATGFLAAFAALVAAR